MTMATRNIICLFILVLIFSSTQQFDLGNNNEEEEEDSSSYCSSSIIETCRSPLGIETGKIPDSAFSSSTHAGSNSTASRARFE